MLNNVEKGNAFRDLIISILAAANFNPVSEVRCNHIKVDCRWTVPGFDERITFFAEAKDYGKSYTKKECNEFISEYGPLVAKERNHRAWLICKGPISADGRALVDAQVNMKAMTFEEFQRKIFRVEGYLSELRDRPREKSVMDWYIPPRSDDGRRLDEVIMQWINDPIAQQLAIIGGYGKGKSTFAQVMCSKLAEDALADQTKRVPILIPLGEINDEVSLEGLIGKHLAATAQVHGYSFSLFSRLNQSGRFVIFLDGFDEMKHGMTFAKFHQMFSELLRLDLGQAKIVILGRDTAMHNDEEFQTIINGRLVLEPGLDTIAPERRPFTPIGISDFSIEEAKNFIRRYFHHVVKRHTNNLDSQWVDGRITELLSDKFDNIILRPVHASMLCEIARDGKFEIQNVTIYGLYSRFVLVLLDREVKKKGRYSGFDVRVRMSFNSALAFWLWKKGGAKTVDLESIPLAICRAATEKVSHNYDEKRLRRELVAGCLVDKGSEHFYFSHRSIQEFLVAEELIRMTRTRQLNKKHFATEAFTQITAEIADFLIAGAHEQPKLVGEISLWLDLLKADPNIKMSEHACEVILRVVDWESVDRTSDTPWMDWLSVFHHGRSTSVKTLTNDAIEDLSLRITRARGKEISEQAAILFLLARILSVHSRELDLMKPLASWFSPRIIADWVDMYDLDGRAVKSVPKETSFFSWAMLTFTELVTEDGKDAIRVDLSQLLECTDSLKRIGFANDELRAHFRRYAFIILQDYLSAVEEYEEPEVAAKVRRFFTNEKLRKRFEATERRKR